LPQELDRECQLALRAVAQDELADGYAQSVSSKRLVHLAGQQPEELQRDDSELQPRLHVQISRRGPAQRVKNTPAGWFEPWMLAWQVVQERPITNFREFVSLPNGFV